MTCIESQELDFIMEQMKDFKHPWYIAGGWAVDLGIGKITREHHDLDICIFREHTQDVLDYFKDWEIGVALPGVHELAPCCSAKDTAAPRYCLHLHQRNRFIEILLTDRVGDYVIYRRDHAVTMSIHDFKRMDDNGRLYVNPIWQLLFKSKNPREHDELDFRNYLQVMTDNERKWLLQQLNHAEPNSPWIGELDR